VQGGGYPNRAACAQFPKASGLMIGQHGLLCHATPQFRAVQPAEGLGLAQG
jgi:hypothetical protein